MGHIKIQVQCTFKQVQFIKTCYWEAKVTVNVEIYFSKVKIIPPELAELTINYTIMCAHKFH